MSIHEISKTEFDGKVLLYLDPGSRPINHAHTQRWFSLPAFVDEDSKQIIVPGSISTLYRSRIVITNDRTVRKFGKALNLTGKKLLPPTYEDLVSKCVHVEEGFNEFVNTENWIKTSPFKSHSHYQKFWQEGEPFTIPNPEYIDLYKLFRDISVKACPSLHGNPSGESTDTDHVVCSDC